MSITFRDILCAVEGNVYSPVIEEEPNKLTIKAGTWAIGGVDYVIDEDIEVDVPVVSDVQAIRTWLVKHKETGEVGVLADIIEWGERSYHFMSDPECEWESAGARVCRTIVPEGTTDLTTCETVVFRMVHG